ncbi:hypothetical protein EVAR_2516_1 [Eumeta japonica]|uniref:Uncharacterized protein n=1 Tax=Eumeta variegata TaxID=151549 RepID=A0A4C1SNY1_EUMVA|nr:hypothetical protein EVAR_2516_1 [Eumeta japonica]
MKLSRYIQTTRRVCPGVGGARGAGARQRVTYIYWYAFKGSNKVGYRIGICHVTAKWFKHKAIWFPEMLTEKAECGSSRRQHQKITETARL